MRIVDPQSDEARVLAAEDAYVAAEIARDERALRHVVDDAFHFNTRDGTTTDEEALVQGVLQMGLVGQVITERSVHLEDDVALVFGTTELRFEHTDTPSVLRYTATYVERQGQWRLLALQMQPRTPQPTSGEPSTA